MKNLYLTTLYLFMSFCVYAQTKVTGRVLAEGRGLSGTSVRIKGQSVATQTDSLGYFSLSFNSANNQLQFSHLGYKTLEVVISSNTRLPLSITLELLSDTLQEIVVSTGYQKIPKERATGSFTVIDREQLGTQVSTNIISRLEALANSVRVDRTTSTSNNDLSIRGLSSIAGPRGVLIVVDNFPYEGDLNNINPSDIENITILKDAAASSIWGARAGNGVIVITTRRGKQGQPLHAEFNSSIALDLKSNLYYGKQLSSADYIDFERYKFAQKYRLSDTSNRNRPVFSPVYEILLAQLSGKISKADADAKINTLAGIDVRDEYNRLVYRNGTRQQYALNLSGGGSNSSWYFSSGFDQNRSELQAAYNRVNLNFQNSWKPLKGLRLDVGLAYTKSNTKSGQQGLDVELEPYIQLADANGNPLAVPRTYRKPYLDTLGRGKLLNWNYYPLLATDQQETNLNLNSSVLNAGVNYAPLSWISLDLKYQYENQNSSSNTLYGRDSYFARSLINQYATLSANAVKFNIPVGGILDLDKNTLDVHNLRAQVNLSKDWGKHRLAALAGSEVRERALSGNTNRTYGYNPGLNTGTLYDAVGTYPHIISGLASIIPSNSNFNDANNRYVSGFANTAYTYADRYTISGSARKDASNLFGLNTNDKWNVLWSAGLAWTVNKESFYQLDAIPDLKLRATYGYSGNVDPGRSALTTILYAGQTVYTGVPFATIQQFGNPDLRWEKVRMINLALDFRSKDDILYGSIDLFSKKSSDLYGPTELDYTTGAGTTITRNVAQVSGKGFDLELYSRPLKGKLSWITNLNLSGYRDEVVSYYAGSSFTLATAVTASAPSFSRVVGTPLYSMYSFKWGGLDPSNGDPFGYLNGVKSKSWSAIVNSSNLNDLVYSGSAIPTLYGSFVNTLRYQNLAFSFSVLYKFGYYFRRNTISYGTMLTTPRAAHQDYLARWQKPGDELTTQIPSFIYPVTSSRESIYALSEQTVEKGDNIRLAYINLDYTLKGRWMTPFKDIHLFFNASNLGILWRANRYGIDPDVAQGSILRGKSFALGIKTNL